MKFCRQPFPYHQGELHTGHETTHSSENVGATCSWPCSKAIEKWCSRINQIRNYIEKI